MLNGMERIRKGRYLHSIITDVDSISEFHEIDNLDKKKLEEAEDQFEKVFIVIREIIEENEQFCCDDEQDRLSLTQVITDALRQHRLIRSEEP